LHSGVACLQSPPPLVHVNPNMLNAMYEIMHSARQQFSSNVVFCADLVPTCQLSGVGFGRQHVCLSPSLLGPCCFCACWEAYPTYQHRCLYCSTASYTSHLRPMLFLCLLQAGSCPNRHQHNNHEFDYAFDISYHEVPVGSQQHQVCRAQGRCLKP
jgi:hypothetical protein